MKFGNPVSSVSISGGTVAITSAGTLTTSGVVTSSPTTTVPASNSKTATISTPTTTNLVAATVGVQVLLISVTVQLYITTIGAGTITFSLQDTGGGHILDLQAQDTATVILTAVQATQFDLAQLLLGSGLGVQVVTGGSFIACVVSLLYTTVAAGGSFTGHTVHV